MNRLLDHIYIRSERKSWFYGPGSQNNEPFLCLSDFWKLGYHLSLWIPWSAF